MGDTDMLVTKEDVTMKYRGYGEITIPKGTRLTNNTAMGVDKNYNFVADLSWIPTYNDGTVRSGLIHDADYYGINIPKHLTEEVGT
jgi:hypothetical protein